MKRVLAVLAVTAAALPLAAVGAHAASHPTSRVVMDSTGMARFEVLTPTLIRLEYSAAGSFEDRPTLNALDRSGPVPDYTATVSPGMVTIDTGKVVLHYTGGGPFTPANVAVDLDVAGTPTTARPTWNPCQQSPTSCPPEGTPGATATDSTLLGGYIREVAPDPEAGTHPPLQGGLLSTRGWTLLDDTSTSILTSPKTAVARNTVPGAYMDGYFFGYGHGYAQALSDLKELTGPSPMLPEWAYGVWMSRYTNVNEKDEHDLVDAFRAHDVPLDALVLDTNWKSNTPNHWNAWEWNSGDFPDPGRFVDWATKQGAHVVLNIHPSIEQADPRYDPSQNLPTRPGACEFVSQDTACSVFDWSNPAQADYYFSLHKSFDDQGVAAWWNDWCCDASDATDRGVTPDSWINQLYGEHARTEGHRPFVLSRVGSGVYGNGYTGNATAPATGAWSDHRNAIGFTGDAPNTFDTIAYEAMLTPAESTAIGLPYLSHDIGGFSGGADPDDVYTRWVQMGTFSSILRLHGKGVTRVPWNQGPEAEKATERMLRLRDELVPYLYSAGAQARATGLPLTRLLAVSNPNDATAVGTKDEWMLGDNLLVAPITTAGMTASRSVYFPAGTWTDFFTGAQVVGPTTRTVTVGLDRMPVYVRAGGIVPLQADAIHTGVAGGPLTLRVGPGAPGSTSLYEDSGDGLAYESGQSRSTSLHTDGAGTVVVDPATGTYPGAPASRSYAVQFLAADRPTCVAVDGAPLPDGTDTTPLDLAATSSSAPAHSWTYDPTTRTVTVTVAAHPVDRPLAVQQGVTCSPGADVPETTAPALLVALGVLLTGAFVLRRRTLRCS